MPDQDGLYIDKRSRRVWVDGHLRPQKLSVDECKLLLFLASCNGEICSRAETVYAVYGTGYDPKSDDGRLDALVGHVRKKIGDDPRSPRFLHTIYHGGHQLLGYKGNKR
ncbi:MAG: winged helix-turn-helix transcriptional regulator [Chloroflexi bacterium]|nr:MAG: winged helix-turn-helix transcriptional regulator [Chloroflexota bacterium]